MTDRGNWVDRLAGRAAWVLDEQGKYEAANYLRSTSRIRYESEEGEVGLVGLLTLFVEPDLKARWATVSHDIQLAVLEAQSGFRDKEARHVHHVQVKWAHDPYDPDWRRKL